MTSHSISFYINQLKQQIMNNLSGEHIRPLQLYIRKLIEENPNDYTSINDAYLTIKHELVETCHDSR
ncbi:MULTISPECIES: hypothetical protein [Lysinibacillus]|jgi:hypothetical protein|uniref:Uncharacterized protein n=1 Tax=Lysinibacillus fusiformis TaxID=28031 RepID=A0A2I0UZJ2_9BACI|nr:MULTISPECIES: hypothetical protein [Lysinibacillus]KUF32549.1 hypothetical protein AK833_13035 [Lysinibacillus sp. F5]MEE3806529.1 hypothetical protein [Lysinibacillus fusiformis]PKU51446.1 hypothetical protein CRI88_12110 [Lysinibacillus fusiformis]SCY78736.1 hypothetical protein SAMN02787078_02476 [Lysinibacillus sp. SG9]SDB40644.1 hypothetical protein SAMN02787079_03032 [Lysinibacillus sp. TC-37]